MKLAEIPQACRKPKRCKRQAENTQAQLKDVNTLLKLDPSNTVLVAQKQELLKNAIADTASKLDTLEAAQKDVTTLWRPERLARRSTWLSSGKLRQPRQH